MGENRAYGRKSCDKRKNMNILISYKLRLRLHANEEELAPCHVPNDVIHDGLDSGLQVKLGLAQVT